MNKFVVGTVIPLVAGFVWAQSNQPTDRTPKEGQSRTWKGMLVGSGCPSSKVPAKRSTSKATSYPVVVSFGLMLDDGRCFLFDTVSNDKISGVLKVPTNWSENTVTMKPKRVEVLGALRGGVLWVEDIAFQCGRILLSSPDCFDTREK